MRCTRALFVMALCLAAAAMVSATPKLVDSFWGKIEPKKSSPAFGLFGQSSSSSNPDNARKAASEAKEQQKLTLAKLTAKKEVQTPKEEELVEDAAAAESEEEPKPIVREIPVFARTILGDLANPKLASMEELRDFDLRTHETFLEPASDMTMPLVEELYRKSQEVLRVFNDLQRESNAFVEDIQNHNDKGNKKYIGYYY